MATAFPSAVDTITQPSSTSPRNNPSLAGILGTLIPAVLALEGLTVGPYERNVLNYYGGGELATALTAAYADLPASGGRLIIPPGTYSMTGQFNPTAKPVIVSGAGADLDTSNAPTFINYAPTVSQIAFKLGYNGCKVENLALKQTNSTAGCSGITINAKFGCTLERVLSYNFTSYGIQLLAINGTGSCIYNRVIACRGINCGTAGLGMNGDSAQSCNNNWIIASQFQGATTQNINMTGIVNDNMFLIVDVSSNPATAAIRVGDGVNQCSDNWFMALTCEGATNGLLFNVNAGGNWVYGTFGNTTNPIVFVGVEQPLWFFNRQTNQLRTYGNTGLRYNIDGSIGMGAAPPLGDGRSVNANGDPYLANGGSTTLSTTLNPANGNVGLLVRQNNGTVQLVQVSMGAADSGGAGFKLLRVPN